MADRKGDKTKQPPECTVDKDARCPNLHEVSRPGDMEGETYECKVCGERYRLDYEEMK